MATVYRARDRRLGREVAVKIIHRHLRENREVAQRFQSEARAVAKLKHPNIVEVYDVSDAKEDERYLVVELIRGVTLRRLLADEGHLPPRSARRSASRSPRRSNTPTTSASCTATSNPRTFSSPTRI